MRHLVQRRNIKFRKRKNGKEKTEEECVAMFEDFLYKLRFNFLPSDEEDNSRHPLYGRFPPSRRYNMDQVPLPFVNGQDVTFTTEDDTDVNIKCPQESLQKRQFTMHLVFNAGIGNMLMDGVIMLQMEQGKVYLLQKRNCMITMWICFGRKRHG